MFGIVFNPGVKVLRLFLDVFLQLLASLDDVLDVYNDGLEFHDDFLKGLGVARLNEWGELLKILAQVVDELAE